MGHSHSGHVISGVRGHCSGVSVGVQFTTCYCGKRILEVFQQLFLPRKAKAGPDIADVGFNAVFKTGGGRGVSRSTSGFLVDLGIVGIIYRGWGQRSDGVGIAFIIKLLVTGADILVGAKEPPS